MNMSEDIKFLVCQSSATIMKLGSFVINHFQHFQWLTSHELLWIGFLLVLPEGFWFFFTPFLILTNNEKNF